METSEVDMIIQEKISEAIRNLSIEVEVSSSYEYDRRALNIEVTLCYLDECISRCYSSLDL